MNDQSTERMTAKSKQFLFGFSVLSLFLVLGLYIYLSYPFRKSHAEAYFIADAQLYTTDFNLPSASASEVRSAIDQPALTPVLPVELHWLRRGAGAVAFLRIASESTLIGSPKDERFAKITIWFPRLRTGEYTLRSTASSITSGPATKDEKPVIGGKDQAIAYYSEGSATELFDTCGGEIVSGRFDIGQITEDVLRARLMGEVDCKPLSGLSTKSVRRIHFNRADTFELSSLSRLTPWLGMRGGRVRDEVIRK